MVDTTAMRTTAGREASPVEHYMVASGHGCVLFVKVTTVEVDVLTTKLSQ